jgi:hypothetical protein
MSAGAAFLVGALTFGSCFLGHFLAAIFYPSIPIIQPICISIQHYVHQVIFSKKRSLASGNCPPLVYAAAS